MRRVVILATLVLLLLAVAGVTTATENTFTTAPQDKDQLEFTVSESTSLESTAPEETDEATVETTIETTVEKTVAVPERPEETVREDTDTAGDETTPSRRANTPDTGDDEEARPDDGEVAGDPAGKPDEPGILDRPRVAENATMHGTPEVVGRPDHPGNPADTGRPEDAGRAEQAGEPDAEDEGEGAGGNPGKVTLCHKNKVTISVGAPAKPAHLRHGDSVGPCSEAQAGAARAQGSPGAR